MAAAAFLAASKFVFHQIVVKGATVAVSAATTFAATYPDKAWLAIAYATGYGRPEDLVYNAAWYVPIRTKRLGIWIVSSVRNGVAWAGLTNPKVSNAVTGPGLEAMSSASGIPEPAVKSLFQLAKQYATSPLGVSVMIAGAILRSGVPISPVFKKFLQKGPGSGFRETCRYIGRVMNYYLGLDDELQTLIHNKMGLKSPSPIKIQPLANTKVNTLPAGSPGRLKLENELAELKLMLQQIKNRQTPLSPVKPKTPSPVKLTPKSPSPNYIYVGGRKIPLLRKPMSPAKAKEGRLRKVVRRVLHGRTEEEKMMKLAKALRKRALAASARSRTASAARSRTASAARSRSASAAARSKN